MTSNKQNIFKTNIRVPVQKEYKRKNTFKLDEKIVEAILNDSDFPDLINKQIHDDIDDNDKLNYKNASLKEVKKEEEVYRLPEGWVSFRYNENRNVIIEPENSFEELEETPEEYHLSAINVFHKLTTNWENYRSHYNDIYGDGEYERQYYMSGYEYETYIDIDE